VATSADELIRNPGKFFIGGEWVAPSSDETISVVTPSTEEVFVTVAAAQEADINRAVAAARDAFDNGPWPRMSPAERAGYMRAFAEKMRERSPGLTTIWTAEMGVTHQVAAPWVPGISSGFDYYAGLADSFQWVERHEALHSPGSAIGLLAHEPVGVVGAIVPWNGPLVLATYKIAPALIAGCTVVLKSSPETPGEGLVLAEIAAEVGLPKGVLNVVTAEREASEALVRHPGVDKITFTGSTAVGKRIASICGERIARCTLELGGKSAAIILDDADIAAAAEMLSQGVRVLTGQVCSSLTRYVVSRDRHDDFVDAVSAAFGRIKVGDPFDEATEMGPLAMKRQRDRVEGYIEIGKSEGARIATGGKRPSHLNRGYFIEPTVFCNVDNSMKIAREEIFGPVVSVIKADDEAHAIAIANDSDFGLNASVFTADANRAYSVARQLRSGTVGHNAFRSDLSIAFGGFKQSGIGREGGIEGLRPYLESKTIILNEVPDQFR
jgi:acyl-CoA reductase-like NAD-dependent aldehyde dehydrogenase